MKIIASLILFVLFVAVSPAFAGDVFDGTKPLLCASIEAVDCDPGEPCDRGVPEIMGAPQFMRIDFAKSEIAGPLRTTKIRLIEKDENQIILQGLEIGLGWTFAIDRDSGNARITFSGWNSSFIIFAACTSYL
jgi:hypothetical protein